MGYLAVQVKSACQSHLCLAIPAPAESTSAKRNRLALSYLKTGCYSRTQTCIHTELLKVRYKLAQVTLTCITANECRVTFP
jgi:hypothetical protein